jgi:hypothetical protein
VPRVPVNAEYTKYLRAMMRFYDVHSQKNIKIATAAYRNKCKE